VKQGTLLEIERRVEPNGDVVEVRGELDLTNASSLDEALSETTGSAVILDLAALAFIDSAGIRTIDQAHRRFTENGRKLLIVAGAESRAAWTFRVAGFADGFVLESVAEAQARADTQPAP
jgi:anti-sigma B factor antagonist